MNQAQKTMDEKRVMASAPGLPFNMVVIFEDGSGIGYFSQEQYPIRVLSKEDVDSVTKIENENVN